MVDSVKRRLRDGVVENEQAPAIMLRDTVATTGGPSLLKYLLLSVCDNVSRGLSQSKGVVVIALSEPPESYSKCLQQSNLPDSRIGGPPIWFRLLDCYTDPLGWAGESTGNDEHGNPLVYWNIRNMDAFFDSIVELGKVSVQSSLSTDRFTIFIDSISVLLRHHNATKVMLLLQAFRSTEQVAAVCWLVHADLHDPRTIKGFEYISSTTIAVEPYIDTEGERGEGGLLTIRQKRKNGRVRENVERFYFTAGVGLSLGPLKVVDTLESVSGKIVVPKVQFNLSLTERELKDRYNVVLPFEHKGNGQEGKIYDGRANIKMSYLASQARDLALPDAAGSKQGIVSSGRVDVRYSQLAPEAREVTAAEEKKPESATLGLGEVHYLRDSDDERPDSDEDPDDDLDI